MVLLVNEVIMDPDSAVWHTPASCASAPKRAERQYFVSTKGDEFLFTHPAPDSLMVQTAMERARSQYPKTTPADKGSKKLDRLGRKVFSSMSLQCHITSYQALLMKYDFSNYSRLANFKDKLRLEDRAQFQFFIEEGRLVAKTFLQASMDVADI